MTSEPPVIRTLSEVVENPVRPLRNEREEHELEFTFDSAGHPIWVKCSCGKEGGVDML